ncbi:MAG: hypothetical protein ABW187_05860 [Dokdonella sp.]
MRTHLLRTVYPSPAIEAIEPDTGNAANDDAPGPALGITMTAPAPLISIVTAGCAAAIEDGHHNASDNDDYYLGGYAGI